MASHYNEIFNAENGFDLTQILQFSNSTMRYFIVNMNHEDLIQFAHAITNLKDEKLINKLSGYSPKLSEKLEM